LANQQQKQAATKPADCTGTGGGGGGYCTWGLVWTRSSARSEGSSLEHSVGSGPHINNAGSGNSSLRGTVSRDFSTYTYWKIRDNPFSSQKNHERKKFLVTQYELF
jgi:hypothetical protein